MPKGMGSDLLFDTRLFDGFTQRPLDGFVRDGTTCCSSIKEVGFGFTSVDVLFESFDEEIGRGYVSIFVIFALSDVDGFAMKVNILDP